MEVERRERDFKGSSTIKKIGSVGLFSTGCEGWVEGEESVTNTFWLGQLGV